MSTPNDDKALGADAAPTSTPAPTNSAAPADSVEVAAIPPTPAGLGDLAIGSSFAVGGVAGGALAEFSPQGQTLEVAELATVANAILGATPTLGAALVILGSVWLALKKGAAVMKERAERSQNSADWASVYAFRDVEALVGWLTSGLSFGYVAWIVGEEWLWAAVCALVALGTVWVTYRVRHQVQARYLC